GEHRAGFTGAGDLEVRGTERLEAPEHDHRTAERSAHGDVRSCTVVADHALHRVLIRGTSEHCGWAATARAARLPGGAADDARRVLPDNVMRYGLRIPVGLRDKLGATN